MRWFLLLALLVGLARAEDPGPAFICVLRVENGQLVAQYKLDKEGQAQVDAGKEAPHLPFLARFVDSRWQQPNKPEPLPWEPGNPSLGRLPGGEILVVRQPDGSNTIEGTGALGVVDASGKFTELLPRVKLGGAGRSLYMHEPRLAVAGLRLLSNDEAGGVVCQRLPDGERLWRAPWQLAHGRWDWGAFEERGNLYVDTTDGLCRIDPATGKVLWTFRDVGETKKLAVGSDGRLYVEYIYAQRVPDDLTGAAVARYGKAHEPHLGIFRQVIPYKTTYFGMTFFDPSGKPLPDYDWRSGTMAIWELKGGRWSWVFELKNPGRMTEGKLDKIFAAHHFSPNMRRRLMRFP